MKKIIILIRLDAYVKTKKALLTIGISSMNTQVVQGRGKKSIPFTIENEGEKSEIYYEDPLLPKQLMEIVVEDSMVDSIVKIVMEANKTGNKGDGKIFVMPVDDVLTIRTGKHEL